MAATPALVRRARGFRIRLRNTNFKLNDVLNLYFGIVRYIKCIVLVDYNVVYKLFLEI